MRHCVFNFKPALTGFVVILILMAGLFYGTPALARSQDIQSNFQEPDLSSAVLRLEDLPSGFFVPVEGSELDSMKASFEGFSISGTSDARIQNFTAFQNSDPQKPHLIVSFLMAPFTASEQQELDEGLSDPELMTEEFSSMGDNFAIMNNADRIGNTGIGFTFTEYNLRGEIILARRGPVLLVVYYFYSEEETPRINSIELARILDDRVAEAVGETTNVTYREAGPYVPELTTSIPTPLDVSTEPGVIGANLFLAGLLMLPFAVAAELFTRILREHEGILQKFRLFSQLNRTPTVQGAPVNRSAMMDALKLLGVMFFYGLVFSLLDRTWNPFSVQGLILFFSMVVAYGAVGIADDIIQWRVIRKWGLPADLRVRPTNFLLAIASTGTSRLLSMVPGLMFGTPEALQTEESQFDETKRNRLLKISANTFIVIGLGVWLATTITAILQRLPLEENALNLIGGLEGFLLVIFAVALENLFVQMLGFPGGFGQVFKRQHKWLWLVALTVVTFLFYHTLINPRGELAEALKEANILLFFGIAIAFMVFAFSLHFYLNRKEKASPALEQAQTSPAVPQKMIAPATSTFPVNLPAGIKSEPVYISINETKQCPFCCNQIKAEAKICRYCKATFAVAVRGYCLTDHDVLEITPEGKCVRCGNELTDLRVESRLIKAPTVLPLQERQMPATTAHPSDEKVGDTKICPACGQTIKAEARICRYCKATFTVKIRGYCITDHAIVEATPERKCIQCGNDVMDWSVESILLKAPAIAVAGETSPSIAPVPITELATPPELSEPELKEETKECPACGKTIKAEAKLCRFCRARFEVQTRGYCLVDRAVVEVVDGKCVKCGNQAQDVHIDSKWIEVPISIPQSKPVETVKVQTPPVFASSEKIKRPGCVTAYAILLILSAGCFAISGLSGGEAYAEFGEEVGTIISLSTFIAALISVVMTIGLWQLKNWARILVLVVTGFGTASSVLTLISVFLAPTVNVSPYASSPYYTGMAMSLISGLIGLGINSTIFGWFRKNKHYFVQESVNLRTADAPVAQVQFVPPTSETKSPPSRTPSAAKPRRSADPTRCAHCGKTFQTLSTGMYSGSFDMGEVILRMRKGCDSCGTPVCFDCAAGAADRKSQRGHCICPSCGTNLDDAE